MTGPYMGSPLNWTRKSHTYRYRRMMSTFTFHLYLHAYEFRDQLNLERIQSPSILYLVTEDVESLYETSSLKLVFCSAFLYYLLQLNGGYFFRMPCTFGNNWSAFSEPTTTYHQITFQEQIKVCQKRTFSIPVHTGNWYNMAVDRFSF